MEHRLSELVKGPVVGASAAVMVDGTIVWQGAAGMADQDAERKATPDTLYEVGSVSKLFTYAAVMQLVEAGKVDLDAPLARYVPGFSIKPPLVGGQGWSLDQITVRSAMTHHSGIPSDVLHHMFSKTPHHYTEYAGLMSQEHAAAAPGRFWSYSNVAVTLLGHLVHQVSGTPFPEYVRTHLFDPLGMARSSFSPEDGLAPEVARSYMKGEPKEWLSVGQKPAGSMVSSAPQLLKFGHAILSGGRPASSDKPVVSPESIRAFFTRQNAGVPLDMDLQMGLGWFLRDLPGVGRVAGHGGATMYHRAHLSVCPERGIAVAVLANSEEAKPKALADLAMQLAAEAQTGVRPPEPELIAEAGPNAEAVGDPRSLAGLWMSPAGLVRVTARGDQLDVSGGPGNFRLDPTGRGTWAGAVVLGDLIPIHVGGLQQVEIRFLGIPGGPGPDEGQQPTQVAVAEHTERGRTLIASRVHPWPIPRGWANRLGVWDVEGGPDWVLDSVVLERRYGVLVATVHSPLIPFPMAFPLRALDGRAAVIDGIGRSRGDAVRASGRGADERIRMLGYNLVRHAH